MSWSPNVAIADQLSKAAPALASFDGALHMMHLGDSSNKIWHSVYDGSSWSENVAIPGQLSAATVGARLAPMAQPCSSLCPEAPA